MVHEFGHSFGGLADEYFYDEDVMNGLYPLNIEPWEQNITTRINFASKWEDMLTKATPVPTPVADKDKYPIGVYEGGATQPKVFIARHSTAACVPTNILPSVRFAKELSNGS